MKQLLAVLIAGLAFAEAVPKPNEEAQIALQALAKIEADFQKQFADLQRQIEDVKKRHREEVLEPRQKVIASQCKRVGLPADCELKTDGTLAAKKVVAPPPAPTTGGSK